MFKISLCVICFLATLSSQLFAQQTGTVIGTVETSDNKPVEYANVHIKNTRIGTITNTKGEFKIANVPVGTHTLVLSFVGLKTQEIEIGVAANQTTNIPPIVLEQSLHELSALVVEARREKFYKKESTYVAKLPLSNIENPQTYTTITEELLEDQVVTNLDDALKNAPGLTKLWESTGRGGDGAAYYSLRGFAVRPLMTNGLPGYTQGGKDPANIERIEVIKGPSGTLYGSNLISYGGLTNVVTKKPYPTLGAEVTYVTGSFGLNRITADINAPLNREHNLLFRLNAAYHTENSFQDAGFKRSIFVAPTLSYHPTERLSFLVSSEIYLPESTNQTMLFFNRGNPLAITTLDALGYNPQNSYTSNDLTIKNPAYSLQSEMNYSLSDTWRSQTVISRSSALSDGYYSYLYDTGAQANNFNRFISKQNATTLATDLQQNFIGDFEVGKLRNRMIVGFDYFTRSSIGNNTGYANVGVVTLRDSVGDTGTLSQPAVDAILSNSSLNKNKTSESVYSAYISNVINITPQISTMLSLRVDRFDNNGSVDDLTDNFEQTAFSPKVGLVFQPIADKVALFANYQNGFDNISPRVQDDGTTKTFGPEQAHQFEGGIKINAYEDRFGATLSYFNIDVSNIVMEDPNRVGFYVQGGKEYRKGFEADVVGNLAPGFSLVAGYSYIDALVTDTDNASVLNTRPLEAGPKHLLNAWLSYRIQQGAFGGLGVGLGGNYSSKYATINYTQTGSFHLPAFFIANASVSYDTDHYRLTLKMNNLTNKEYYQGWTTVNPQKPRNISASYTYRF